MGHSLAGLLEPSVAPLGGQFNLIAVSGARTDANGPLTPKKKAQKVCTNWADGILAEC
jgi:hypothetical protein